MKKRTDRIVYHYENERGEFVGASRFQPKSEFVPRGYRYWRCFRHRLKPGGRSPADCRETYRSERAFVAHLRKAQRGENFKRRQHTVAK